MKTFAQFVKEAVPNPNPKPPRKIAGHTFAEEQIEELEPQNAKAHKKGLRA